jgi:hypothetical protein
MRTIVRKKTRTTLPKYWTHVPRKVCAPPPVTQMLPNVCSHTQQATSPSSVSILGEQLKSPAANHMKLEAAFTMTLTKATGRHRSRPYFKPCTPYFKPCTPYFKPCTPYFKPCTPNLNVWQALDSNLSHFSSVSSPLLFIFA